MKKWLCKFDPVEGYDLIGAACDPELKGTDHWPTQKSNGPKRKHAYDLKKGDLCLFWQTGDKIAIVGYGLVKRSAQKRKLPASYTKYQITPEEINPDQDYEVIEISYERIFADILLLDTLKKDPAFSDQSFVTARKTATYETFHEIGGSDWELLEKYLLPKILQIDLVELITLVKSKDWTNQMLDAFKDAIKEKLVREW